METGSAGESRRSAFVPGGRHFPRWRLEVHDTLPSTADLVRTRAESGEAAGLAALALRQTQGRGSRGREWVAPEGNLNLSILLRPAIPAAQAGRFALLAGVALAETVDEFLPGPSHARLKWPNDVLLDGAKLAGILIDAAMGADGAIDWLAIGMGANLAAAPEIPGRPTIALARHTVPPSPETFASRLLAHLADWLAREDEGGAALIDAWRARAHLPGERLRIALGADIVTGEYEGITPDGNLLLRTEDGPRSLATGEILLGTGA